ncbi:MAG: linear amide C-N hydrolase [Achromobacter sp.]|nr:linear amide C-N hydrolase [Achromobacter sp.]
MLKTRLSVLLTSALAALGIAYSAASHACTRAVYLGDNDLVLTARSMDWKSDLKSNLWVFPRGLERNGQTAQNPLRWTSKYGSVITAAHDLVTTDGLNEKGLSANLLWLAGSVYPQWDGGKPGVSVATWTQYVLDNFATVQEVVEAMKAEQFTIVTGLMPGEDKPVTVHLSVSDATGNSAIFEYVEGKLAIYHDRAYTVMTNEPTYDRQLALDAYWKGIGGSVMLPGTNRPADRFARASFYIDALPKSADLRTSLAGVLGVIRNASVPLGITFPDQPNVSSTLWRTVADHKNRVYYFESALTPNTISTDLKKLNLSQGAPTRKLELTQQQVYAGEVNDQFQDAKPFKLR